jgi:hypothetical protein
LLNMIVLRRSESNRLMAQGYGNLVFFNFNLI